MAAWQGVMALVAILSLGFTAVGLAVAASHLGTTAAALAVFRANRGHLPLILGIWILFVIDWACSPTAESTLLFAACWMCNLNGALPAFLLRERASWCAPLCAAVAVPVAMVVIHPDLLSHPLVSSISITVLAITAATRIGQSYLIDYTDGVDAEARALEDATAALATRKSATHQAAEDARVLHDTAINTLGAIANGGAAIDDADAVRSRCLADIATIESLRSAGGDDAARRGFRDAIRPSGFQVRYVGMSDDEIADIEKSLPPHVVRAFSRALAEAVQNAGKHSGTDEAVISFSRTADSVRVTVSDRGIGIQRGRRYGVGIERSIIERAREAGIRAAIDSVPDQGTTVTLEYVFNDAVGQPHAVVAESGNVEDLVQQLRPRSAFALSAGLVGVGVALAASNHPGEATPEWLMVAVVATACWLAWRERHHARLSAWTTIALIASGPIAFLMSAWAVGFGRTEPILWQAVAPTAPLLVLMIVELPRTVKTLGLLAYLLTVVATAVTTARTSLEAAYITALAGLLGLGLIGGVMSFMRSLATVAARANSEQRKAFAAGLELAAMEAATETRRRWRDAGLEQSIELLRAIGEGRMDSQDPAVRERCAKEEAFLRQLSLLNPELIQMGTWFARALNASRVKGVGLTVRAGAADATARDAPEFGSMLLEVIDAMPPGTKLTTAFFATARGLAMTLVAPTPHLISALRGNERRSNELRLQTLRGQDFVELVVAGNRS